MTKTIFEKIIARDLPAEILYEDEDIICIRDKFPKAPIHILLITKKVIPSIHDLKPEDYPLLGKIITKAQEIATQEGVSDNYRLMTNRGPKAGQTIYHLHFHLMAGI
jgi:histidine triad (HIT) family protein